MAWSPASAAVSPRPRTKRSSQRPSKLSSSKLSRPLSSPRTDTPRSSSWRSSKFMFLKLASLFCCTYLLGLAALSLLISSKQSDDKNPQHIGLGSVMKASRHIQGNWHLYRNNSAVHIESGHVMGGKSVVDSRSFLRVRSPVHDLHIQAVDKGEGHISKARHASSSSDDQDDASDLQESSDEMDTDSTDASDLQQDSAADHSNKAPPKTAPHHDLQQDSSADHSNKAPPKTAVHYLTADTDTDSSAHQNKAPPTTAPHHLLSGEGLARGVAGLPMRQTPALVGAKRGTIHCDDENVVNDLAYWNDPQGVSDQQFVSPFDTGETKYLSFEPDFGGWNNVRMNMEIMFVLAAATGRTIVLPPDEPMYLLGHGVEGAKSFGEFFDLSSLAKRTEVMSMSQFLKLEGTSLLGLDQKEKEKLVPTAKLCQHREGNEAHWCESLMKVLRSKGMQPNMTMRSCLVFDEDVFQGKNASDIHKQRVSRFCGPERKVEYYTQELHEPKYIHWNGRGKHRLLNHFYTTLYFTNSTVDNHFKRFVRDMLHYRDTIFCAAGKIVHALHKQANGTFSTLHVRRGDLQFREAVLPAEEWYNNSKDFWKPKELLYIATDERNKTMFGPIQKHHPVKFLDDYWESAGLGALDSAYLGMIDTIVAAQGRTHVGTWHSTFSGYINRIRGYSGFSMNNSWYSYLPRKTRMHGWDYPTGNYYAREWPIAWVGIDGNEVLEKEQIPQ